MTTNKHTTIEELESYRKEFDMSYKDFCDFFAISRESYRRYRNGEVKPPRSIEVACKLRSENLRYEKMIKKLALMGDV